MYAGTDPRLGLTEIGDYARRVEAAGYDGMHVSETVHDPFLLALQALQATSRIVVRTSVALAFVRSPVLTAYTAWDLSAISGGRFHLGLGSQVRQNIEQRYAMPWSEPAPRMRQYVQVVRAAFETFRTGELTPFDGKHYRFLRMQPYFNPHRGATDRTAPDIAAPPIYLGGVGRGMCLAAGELADGFVTHPTNSSPQYLEQDCLPALAEGAAVAGRTRADLDLVAGVQVITGATDADVSRERERQRRLFAFLYSTPAYHRELERSGLGGLREPLARMVRRDSWSELREVVTDDVLDAMLPTAPYSRLAEVIRDRVGGRADAVTLALPSDPEHDALMAEVVGQLHE
ncbi:TIGR03617 family F420-dependent LLM class oxidoreductase [Rhodococcus spelaei]|uniref:TIGR03617 family F420-dependent LLM class oxidoreductase n=1 Tax=Rhodococcus spelaei TaxID=2546320 RepID=UPI001FE9F817|nr:TIGR03617 family F420-dependent LLM class oxidoreductase [Rhodococcus spelaei]